MEKEDYGFYDSIDNTATRWLAWNLDTHKKIGFQYLGTEPRSMWLLCITRNLYTYCEADFYINSSYFLYLWLRYVKKFKFLRFYRKRKHQDVFLIDSITFVEEVAEACNITPEVIDVIYETYYKR